MDQARPAAPPVTAPPDPGWSSDGRDHDRPRDHAATDGRPRGDVPLHELVGRLIDDLGRLLRQEIELAKIEVRRDLTQAAKASGLLVGGAIAGSIALLLVLFAAAWALALVMPVGLAFLVVAVVVALAALASISTGRKRLRDVDLTPHAALASLQRDQHVIAERSPR